MTTARHEEPSLLMSLDDDPYPPSPRLLDLAARVVPHVARMNRIPEMMSHPLLSARQGPGRRWYRCPGEHYHLLTVLCRVLKPKIVWEFGTGGGMSAVAMVEGCHPSAVINTVDVDQSEPSWILSDDKIVRHMGDMSDDRWTEQLVNANLIFVDGPKDGLTEAKFTSLLDSAAEFIHTSRIVVFDDTRLMNMVHVWRGIAHPKMDLTSFGHWSGTGIVDWV